MTSIPSLHLLHSSSFSPQEYINVLFDSNYISQTSNSIPTSKDSIENRNLNNFHSNVTENYQSLPDPHEILSQHQFLLHEKIKETSIKFQNLQESSNIHEIIADMSQKVEYLINKLESISIKHYNEENQNISYSSETNKLNSNEFSFNSSKDPFEKLKEWFTIREKLEHCCKILKTAQIVSEGIESLKPLDNNYIMDNTNEIKRISNSIIVIQKAFLILKQDGYDKHFHQQQQRVDRYLKRMEEFIRERFIEIFRKRERWISRGEVQEKTNLIISEAKEEVKIAQNINVLESVFKQYIERECKETILKNWNNIIGKQISSKSIEMSEPLSQQLPLLYNPIITFLNRDSNFYLQIFEGTKFQAFQLFIIEILTPLIPQIQSFLKQGSFPDAISCYEISVNFVNQIDSIIKKFSAIHEDTNLVKNEQENVRKCVLHPYQSLKQNYASLERNYFRSYLETYLSVYKCNRIEVDMLEIFILNVKTSTEQLFNSLREGISRCLMFTNGIELPSLIQTINQEIKRFSVKTSSLMNGFQNTYLTPSMRPKLPYSNRLLIQHFLHLFQICKIFIYQSIEFTKEIRNIILKSEEEIRKFSSNLIEKSAIIKFLKDLSMEDSAPFKELIDKTHELFKQSIYCTQKVLTLPIKENLRAVPQMTVWSHASISQNHTAPQDYIQNIYQHLVELPGDLQLFENNLQEDFKEIEIPNWLTIVCEEAIKQLKDTIVQIPTLSEFGRKQLLTDINYFTPLVQILIQKTDPEIFELTQLIQCNTKEEFQKQRANCENLPKHYQQRLKKIIQFQ